MSLRHSILFRVLRNPCVCVFIIALSHELTWFFWEKRALCPYFLLLGLWNVEKQLPPFCEDTREHARATTTLLNGERNHFLLFLHTLCFFLLVDLLIFLPQERDFFFLNPVPKVKNPFSRNGGKNILFSIEFYLMINSFSF